MFDQKYFCTVQFRFFAFHILCTLLLLTGCSNQGINPFENPTLEANGISKVEKYFSNVGGRSRVEIGINYDPNPNVNQPTKVNFLGPDLSGLPGTLILTNQSLSGIQNGLDIYQVYKNNPSQFSVSNFTVQNGSSYQHLFTKSGPYTGLFIIFDIFANKRKIFFSTPFLPKALPAGGGGGSGGGTKFGPLSQIKLPPPYPIGPITIHAEQKDPKSPGFIILANGKKISTYPNGQKIFHVLAEAIRNATPGDVIGLKGYFKGAKIGDYDPSKKSYAYWGGKNNDKIHDLAIISEDPNNPATIGETEFRGNILKNNAGGYDNLYFKDITFINDGGSRSPIIQFAAARVGRLGLYNVTLDTGSPGKYSGYGMKWGFRGAGSGEYDVRGLTCKSGAQEHCTYIDSPGGVNGGDSYFVNVTQLQPSGRTGMQFVERAQGSNIPSDGGLLIDNATLWTKAGGGGSALTVANHSDTTGKGVEFTNSTITTNLGAIAVWPDFGKGLFLNPQGYSTERFYMHNITLNTKGATREQVMIGSTMTVQIGDFTTNNTNKVLFSFDKLYGSGKPVPQNGSVEFDMNYNGSLCQYPGFEGGLPLLGNVYKILQVEGQFIPTQQVCNIQVPEFLP